MKRILFPSLGAGWRVWKAGILSVLAVCVFVANAPLGHAVGTWVPLAHAAPKNAEHMVLLTDGTVLASDNSTGTGWFKLTPDIHGSYINGTWSNIAAMHNSRYFFQSQVLTNGQLFVSGGEYGNGSNSAEIYNPISNVWTSVNPPANIQSNSLVDALSILLPNGDVFIPPVYNNGNDGETTFFNPASNIWSAGPHVETTSLDEASWVMLPDKSIVVDEAHGSASVAQRYIPSLNAWINDTTPPVDIYSFNQELGPAFLLPNGNAIFFGGTSTNLIYVPSGTTNHGAWQSAANFPNGQSMPDAPGAMMMNGKILLATTPQPYYNNSTTNGAPAPTTFYEYDYTNGALGTFTQAPVPVANNNQSQGYNMLDLPDGTVLLSYFQSTNLYVYQPDGSPIAAGKPTIQNISVNADGSLHLTGTLFNGISAGSSFGDDWQEDSNYPLVRFTDSSGNIRYGRTYHWSGGVATGANIVSTDCDIPSGASLNDSIQVVANGISSAGVSYSSFIIYVDYSYSGLQFGTEANPFNTIHTAYTKVANGGVISILGGHSTTGGDGHITISKPIRIVATSGTASIGPN